jgi:coiled-coil domain-containing protein 130
MSSLAAARADNFYHPPDWDPRKRSRAAHAAGPGAEQWKAHPLRERAKKLDQGILTIRFEMPFNVRCSGCDNHIAKGVRFNAEKKTIGRYLSTKILSFRMMCHCEDGTSRTDHRRNPHFIEIHTDPKNAEYVVADGAVRVAEPSLLSPSELGVEAMPDPEESKRRDANPFYKLEHAGPAAQKKPWLTALQDRRDADWQHDYDANAALRRAHRAQRHQSMLHEAQAEAKGVRVTLPESRPDDPADADAVRAAEPGRAAKRRKASVALGEPRMRLLGGSIFDSSHTRAAAERETDTLRLLRLRRERGMRIAAAAPPARASPARAAPPCVPSRSLAAPPATTAPASQTMDVACPASGLCTDKARPDANGSGGDGAGARPVAGLVAYSDTDSDE